MNSTIARILLVVPCSLFIVTTLTVSTVAARSLDSEELLVGNWQLSLVCTPQCFDELFPPRIAVVLVHSESESDSPTKETTKRPARSQRGTTSLENCGDYIRRRWPRRFGCNLKVFRNGTFALEPTNEALSLATAVGGRSSVACLEKLSSASKDDTMHHSDGKNEALAFLPIRGRWNVLSNPYCATDRFYDDLHLSSYPRAQKRIENNYMRKIKDSKVIEESSKTTTTAADDNTLPTLLKRVHLHFHCRLYGHYTDGGLIRKLFSTSKKTSLGDGPYCRGRLSHGAIVQDQQQRSPQNNHDNDPNNNDPVQQHPWWSFIYRRRVVASFTAKRRIPPFAQLMDQWEEDDLSNYEIYKTKRR
jgi:hypothetical protein